MFPPLQSAALSTTGTNYGSIYTSLTGLAFISVHFTSLFTVSISEEHRFLDENGENRGYIGGYRNKYSILMHYNNLYWYE